jgi:alkyl hydroperoxide reductase subunit F
VKLDPSLIAKIKGIEDELNFETIISLDCHICPDVVQVLNQMAILNPKIKNEMIDGGLHQKFVEERNVQGVPTVFLNKKPFSSGQISASEVLDKIQNLFKIRDVKAENDETIRDVAIIGGGPAAVSAAIYTARKGLDVVLISEKFGGQVRDTVGIENLISVSSTTGQDLTKNMMVHLNEYPVSIRQDIRVQSIEETDGRIKQLNLSTGSTLKARTVILATGAKWRELGVPGEKENIGKGVAYCAHCDGPYFKGKDVVVVGGGNSGIETALDLSAIVKSVTVVEFLDTLKADKVLVEKVQETDNISIITSAATNEILANDKGVTGVKIKMRETGEVSVIDVQGVFVQIGLIPNSGFVKDLIKTNDRGEIIINSRGETSVPGIFACGDVTDVPYKQIIVAMGEGAKAGLTSFDYLLRTKAKVDVER